MQSGPAIARVARECVEDLAADGVVYAEVRYAPEQHVSGGLTLDEVVEAVQEGFDAGHGRQRRQDRRTPAADRDAAPGPVDGDRRAGGRVARPRRRRLRHRRRRGRLPAHPAPRRLRVPPARERPLHHPRRRGLRPAVDLAGDPVVRRRPARPRRADHRRHHRRRRRVRRARPAGGLRPRQADPAGDVPELQHPDRRGGVDRRAPDRAADRPALPGHRQHRQPADERHLDDPRDVRRWSRRSATRWRTCAGSPSTR